MKSWITKGLAATGAVVFPPSCVSCGKAVDASDFEHVCADCAKAIDIASSPCCSTCGHPFYGAVESDRLCPHCLELAPAYREGRTAVLSKGPARDLIHELKYRRGLYVLSDIEKLFRKAQAVLEIAHRAHLVPVPLHPRKLRERGYNQSALIAEALCNATGRTATVVDILERRVDTPSQTQFDRKTRIGNLKNAFALRTNAVITADHHYVLVDDVFTTGSTLNSCARVLRQAGILNLDVVTFGHG